MNDDDRQRRDLKRIQIFSCDTGGRFLAYSGEGNARRAADYAREHGKCRLDDTELGQVLLPDDPDQGEGIYREYDNELNAGETMFRASRQCTRKAYGSVETFVIGAEPYRAFRHSEQRNLLNNEDVTDINGVPREELKHVYDTQGERACFKRICEAELARDRARLDKMEAGTVGYGAAQESLQSRQNKFSEKFGETVEPKPQTKSDTLGNDSKFKLTNDKDGAFELER